MYREATALDPTDSDLQNILAKALEQAKNLAEAERANLQATTRKPGNPAALLNLGPLYEGQNRVPEAIKVLEKCLEHVDDNEAHTAVTERLTRLFPKRKDVVQLYKGLRTWPFFFLLTGGVLIFLSEVLGDRMTGSAYVIVAVITWRVRAPAVFVVNAVLFVWPAAVMASSVLAGGDLWRLGGALFWAILASSHNVLYKRYRPLRLQELYRAGAWPAGRPPPEDDLAVADRFAATSAVLAGALLFLLPTACVIGVGLAAWTQSPGASQLLVDLATGVMGLAIVPCVRRHTLCTGGSSAGASMRATWRLPAAFGLALAVTT